LIRAAAAALAALAVLLVASASPAGAQTVERPESLDEPPRFHRLTGRQVIRIANRVPKIRAERARTPRSTAEVFTKGPTRWQVSYFSRGRKREIAQVLVDDRSGAVLEAWTGFRVPWTMARGYDGAFGRKVNAPYVWIPLLVAFLVPFVNPRRPFQLFHLDLLALAAFSISLAFFTAGKIETSVPLVYPLLGYLLARMLWVGLRRGPREPPRLLVGSEWLLVGIVFLLGFRVGLNVLSSNVIDVGYAGVVGADKIMDGDPLYGNWPTNNQHGDTYGPVNYLLYIPFEQLLPWSGSWDELPAAHVAALVFDALVVVALWLVGRRISGNALGVALAYAWVAFPFTLYVTNTNANDALVPLAVLVMLLVAHRPVARGAATAVAGLTKFAPLALAPLFAMQDTAERSVSGDAVRRTGTLRAAALTTIAFLVVAAAVLLAFVDDARLFWDRTLGFQADRDSPFSLWGLYDLDVVQRGVQVAAVALAIVLTFVPRRRDLAGLAALSAAILIALQLGTQYWFYLYVVWFFPLVMLALLAPSTGAAPPRSTPLAATAAHSGSAPP
jgi:hypothetical protein